MKAVVIGAGLAGLTAAHELKKSGWDVTVVEREGYVGGLSSAVDVNGAKIERFYHHIFKGDEHIMRLMQELGLQDRMVWETTKMGYHTPSGNHRFGTPADLLMYPELNPVDKLRFGLIILEMQYRKNWMKLDSETAEHWLRKKGGDTLYESIWAPLMDTKFGELKDTASAAWLWGRIHPRANSRAGMKEVLGYMRGSFQELLDRLAEGLDVRLNTEADKITDGMVTAGEEMPCDAVVYTGAVDRLPDMVELPDEYSRQLRSIKYQAVACMLVKMKKPLGDFYWLNNGDKKLTVGGVIEHTNFMPAEEYGGHMAYAFTYLSPEDPLLQDEKRVKETFTEDLGEIYPTFNADDILWTKVFTSKRATPVYDTGFKDRMPSYKTPVKGLYVAGMTSVYPLDRNMDGAVKVGKEVAKEVSGTRPS